uniref:Protein Churchill n=1 Tax=Strigamia maritima TaxID=126957 RepID=T1JJU4_STRMM
RISWARCSFLGFTIDDRLQTPGIIKYLEVNLILNFVWIEVNIKEMCEQCVKSEFPDRGKMCLDTGAYLLNYQGCIQCQHKDTLEIVNRVAKEDEDGEELITFQHKCSNCDHLIANHEYSFKVNGGYQEYEMECLLCGRAEDSISIMPDDPRLQNDTY